MEAGCGAELSALPRNEVEGEFQSRLAFSGASA
jgi:hypothetical protein